MADQITFSQIKNWFTEQFSMKSLVHTTMVMGIFGLIPGAWMVGIPALILYGVVKQRSMLGTLRGFLDGLSKFWNNFERELDLRIIEAFNNDPISILKGLGAITLILAMGLNSWSLFAIYGIYRFTNNQWQTTFTSWMRSFYQHTMTIYNNINDKVLGISCFLIAMLALQIFMGGVGSIGLLGTGVIELAIVLTGLSAVFKDLGYALQHPIKAFMENSGKILGTLWGGWLAFHLYPGSVLRNVGLILGFAASFPLQFYGMVAAGYLAGYAIERFVDNLYSSLSNTPQVVNSNVKLVEKQDQSLGLVSKLHLGLIAAVTPLFLCSAGGIQLIALAGGSILGATGITALGLGTAATAVQALGGVLKDSLDSLFGKPAAAVKEVAPTVNKIVSKKPVEKTANKKAAAKSKAITPVYQLHLAKSSGVKTRSQARLEQAPHHRNKVRAAQQ